MDDMKRKIAIYFHLELSQMEILTCLGALDDVDLSLRTLQRLLRSAKFYRRKFKSDIQEVALFLELELGRYGKMHAYMMHLKCIQEGYVVSQETIRLLLDFFLMEFSFANVNVFVIECISTLVSILCGILICTIN